MKRPEMTWRFLFTAAALAFAGAASAQPVTASVDQIACVPLDGERDGERERQCESWARAVVEAQVANAPGGSEVRLYFRRLHHEVEDFYYVPMQAAPGGRYWGVLPDPENVELRDFELAEPQTDDERRYRTAAWWLAKGRADDRDPNDDLNASVIRERAALGRAVERDWMRAMSLADLERWLDRQEYEPAEYYVAVFDAGGRQLARTELRAAPVTRDCRVTLTPQQAGQACNLVVGETAAWQVGEEVFHWECDGIVSRIDPAGVLREDELCRGCVVAWWTRPAVLIPAATVLGVGILVDDDDDDVSPVRP